MSSVIVWVAVAVIASSGGAQIIHSEQGYASKADCEAVQAQAKPRIAAYEGVEAFGQACVAVKVEPNKDKKK